MRKDDKNRSIDAIKLITLRQTDTYRFVGPISIGSSGSVRGKLLFTICRSILFSVGVRRSGR